MASYSALLSRRSIAFKKWMLEGSVFKRATFETGELGGRAELAGRYDGWGEFGGNDVHGIRLRAG